MYRIIIEPILLGCMKEVFPEFPEVTLETTVGRPYVVYAEAKKRKVAALG